MKTINATGISGEVKVTYPKASSGLSPAIISNDDGTYDMWVVDTASSPNTVKRFNSTDNGITFGNTTSVTINCNNTTQKPWHIDVEKYGSTYYALICYTDGIVKKTTGTNTTLRLGISNDGGYTFNVQDTPILSPGSLYWNNQLMYRSTGLVDKSGIRVWYSAEGMPEHIWGIGYVRVENINGAWQAVNIPLEDNKQAYMPASQIENHSLRWFEVTYNAAFQTLYNFYLFMKTII
jgi:hypothetical protein